jgi:hypothetical protein
MIAFPLLQDRPSDKGLSPRGEPAATCLCLVSAAISLAVLLLQESLARRFSR